MRIAQHRSKVKLTSLMAPPHFHDAGSGFTGNVKWDLGGRHFNLGVLKAVKLSQGRLVELGMALAEKTGLVTLEAAVKPHKDHRLNATCARLPLPSRAMLLDYPNMHGCHTQVGGIPLTYARIRIMQLLDRNRACVCMHRATPLLASRRRRHRDGCLQAPGPSCLSLEGQSLPAGQG